MSEEATSAEHQSQQGKPRRKVIGLAAKLALLEVIERKQRGYFAEYKAVAARHGVNHSYLRHLYCDWKKGLIDMGPEQTIEEKRLDDRRLFEQKRKAIDRYDALTLGDFQFTLERAEAALDRGDREEFDKLKAKLDRIFPKLKAIAEVKDSIDKGYLAILEQISQSLDAKMKRANGTVVDAVTAGRPVPPEAPRIQSATEEQRALEALTIDVETVTVSTPKPCTSIT